jgi:hypothetical protein
MNSQMAIVQKKKITMVQITDPKLHSVASIPTSNRIIRADARSVVMHPHTSHRRRGHRIHRVSKPDRPGSRITPNG